MGSRSENLGRSGSQTLRSREHSHRVGTDSDNFFIKFGGRETRVGWQPEWLAGSRESVF